MSKNWVLLITELFLPPSWNKSFNTFLILEASTPKLESISFPPNPFIVGSCLISLALILSIDKSLSTASSAPLVEAVYLTPLCILYSFNELRDVPALPWIAGPVDLKSNTFPNCIFIEPNSIYKTPESWCIFTLGIKFSKDSYLPFLLITKAPLSCTDSVVPSIPEAL